MLKAGLFGYPVDHSLSPVIHTCAYRELGLDWSYELQPCETRAGFSEALKTAVADFDSHVGFNITTPHKVAAFKEATVRSKYAEIAGSANVLTFLHSAKARGDSALSLMADNTDGRGLVASLKREGCVSLKGASVVVCGSGAVAMSALLSLLEEDAATIRVACRNTEKGEQRVDRVVQALGSATEATSSLRKDIKVINLGDVAHDLETADILIDATTLGMFPGDAPVVDPAALHDGLTVLDVVYGHGETALLKAAREAGAKAIDGLGMLIEQAALTVEIWAGEQGLNLEAPREAMRKAALGN